MTVTYDWLTDTTTIESSSNVDLIYPIGTDFSVITTLLRTPDTGSTGIKVTDGVNDIFFSVGPKSGTNVIAVPPGINYLALQWSAGTYMPFSSSDGVVWNPWDMPLDVDGNQLPYPPLPTPPTNAGLFFETNPATTTQEVAQFGSPQVLPGTILAQPALDWIIFEEQEDLLPIGISPPTQPDPLTPSAEAVVHALVGAPYGDMEFDVGKSVGWLSRFVDDLFVTDINFGVQRYWVVNWTASFNNTYYRFSGKNFFDDPAAYRQGQFDDAVKYAASNPVQLEYDDNDWVIFLDAHEGMSTDTRSKPDDYLIARYKSFIYREIARANDADLDQVVLPFFVFLRHDHIQNVSQSYTDLDGNIHTVTQSAGVPYYQPNLGLTRIFRVSALRDPGFDWSVLDTPVTVVDPTVKVQLVSYAYAHWNLQDIPPGETRVPQLAPDNDEGWKQRCSISRVIPITGLLYGDYQDPVGTWVHPVNDIAGLRGPWCFDTYADLVTDAVIPDPPPAIDPATAGILTPMYDLVFRINVRDGVWYGPTGVGNTQLVWSDDLQEWIAYGQPVPPPFQFFENPPGSGLYEAIPPLIENPPGSGLYEIPPGTIETPPGSGLYVPS